MIRTETERQFYLGTVGIRLWYARRPLPGAAPSPDFEFLPEPPRGDQVTPGPVASPGMKPGAARKSSPSQTKARDGGARIADLQALMEDQPVARKGPEQEPAATTPGSEAARESDSERSDRPVSGLGEVIDIRIWAGNRVALIADFSSDASQRLQEVLAANILASVGEQRPRDLGRIGWPIFNNLRVLARTGSDVQEVLRSLVAGINEHEIMVLRSASKGNSDWIAEALGRSPAVSFSYSLAELAGDADLKRKLWHLIKPLGAR
ncbi:MAG: 2-isopropylmalate synthase [Pseudomonadota bacterium]|nr:2-isopropylmalate synthase [Pseudomonadota bacterium]